MGAGLVDWWIGSFDLEVELWRWRREVHHPHVGEKTYAVRVRVAGGEIPGASGLHPHHGAGDDLIDRARVNQPVVVGRVGDDAVSQEREGDVG